MKGGCCSLVGSYPSFLRFPFRAKMLSNEMITSLVGGASVLVCGSSRSSRDMAQPDCSLATSRRGAGVEVIKEGIVFGGIRKYITHRIISWGAKPLPVVQTIEV
jgi:hypothetical protein